MAHIEINLTQEESHWMSISDIMTGLMTIFLFISISYMLITQIEKEKIKELSVLSTQKQNDLYEALNQEFKHDLVRWNAVIDQQTLSVKFQTPDILFKAGSDILALEFKNILEDFYPRYIKTLSQTQFRDDIEEIRIEGHTSSEWAFKVSDDDAYHNNMKLSQSRTLSVLQFVNNLDEVSAQKKWLQTKTIAIGKSSSQTVKNLNGFEDKEKSRRVEFMVKTNAETATIKMIQEILE